LQPLHHADADPTQAMLLERAGAVIMLGQTAHSLGHWKYQLSDSSALRVASELVLGSSASIATRGFQKST